MSKLHGALSLVRRGKASNYVHFGCLPTLAARWGQRALPPNRLGNTPCRRRLLGYEMFGLAVGAGPGQGDCSLEDPP